MTTLVTNAPFAIREFDHPDTAFYLKAALPLTDGSQTEKLKEIITMVDENHLFEAESHLIAFLPPEEMGRASYSTNCAPCHGDDGSGGMGPNLRKNAFIQSKSEQELIDFILAGRHGTAMYGFEGILGNEEISNIILLLCEWQGLAPSQP